jgi:hypothetical protein
MVSRPAGRVGGPAGAPATLHPSPRPPLPGGVALGVQPIRDRLERGTFGPHLGDERQDVGLGVVVRPGDLAGPSRGPGVRPAGEPVGTGPGRTEQAAAGLVGGEGGPRSLADQPGLHNHDGTIETPSATAWATSHQLAITQDLRDAVCDQMGDRSAGKSRADVRRCTGDGDLLGRSTVIDIVHREGERLIVARREQARAVLDEAPEARLALLGPAVADPGAVTGFVDDDLPFDDSEEAQAEWEQVQAEWIATGFPAASRRPRWAGTSPVRWTRAS